jgi:hypothetical protein
MILVSLLSVQRCAILAGYAMLVNAGNGGWALPLLLLFFIPSPRVEVRQVQP